MPPFSPSPVLPAPPSGATPSASQSASLKILLSPHIQHALSVPPSTEALQFLAVGLSLQAAETMNKATGGRRTYEEQDLEPLRLIIHLTKDHGDAADPLVIPTQLLLDTVLAYPEHSSTVRKILDDARRSNSAVFGEIDLQVVGPSFRLLEEESEMVAENAKHVMDLSKSRAHASQEASVLDPQAGVQTILRTTNMLHTLALAHPTLTKSILTSSGSLSTLCTTYTALTSITSFLHSSTNVFAMATPQAGSFRRAVLAKAAVVRLLHALVGGLQQSEREWKLGNLERADGSPSASTTCPMINFSLVEDHAIFYPDEGLSMDMSLPLTKAGKGGNHGGGQAQHTSSTSIRVDERIIDILRSISPSEPGGQEPHHDLVGPPPPSKTNTNNAQQGISDTNNGSSSSSPRVTPKATPKETGSIATIHGIFPHLPAHLLLEALRHPKFATGTGAGEEGLINALLEDDLPKGLEGLARVLRGEEIGGTVDAHGDRGSSSAAMSRTGSGGSSGSASHAPIEMNGSKGKEARKPFKRDNIWDEAPMDFAKLRIGKDESALANLTSAIPDHIRSSILRLTEQQQEEEAAELEAEQQEAAERRERARAAASGSGPAASSSGTGRSSSRPVARIKTVAFEEELEDWERQDLDELGRVVKRPARGGDDGEDYDEDLGEGEDLDEVEGMPGSSYASGSTTPNYRANPTHNPSWNPPIPFASSSSSPYGAAMPDADPAETFCELAYLRDPKLFDRDGSTRRGKGREELRRRTGWTDEQVEGWRIMLERNPRKDKILSRHGPLPPSRADQRPSNSQDQFNKKSGQGQQHKSSKTSANNRAPPGSKPRPQPTELDNTRRHAPAPAPSSTTTATDEDWGGGPAVPLDPWDAPNPKNMIGFNPRNDGTKKGIPGGGPGKDKAPKSEGGGGGGSRGGQNKSSRGHSNAARTRGHDKKMARMGVV